MENDEEEVEEEQEEEGSAGDLSVFEKWLHRLQFCHLSLGLTAEARGFGGGVR